MEEDTPLLPPTPTPPVPRQRVTFADPPHPVPQQRVFIEQLPDDPQRVPDLLPGDTTLFSPTLETRQQCCTKLEQVQ